MKKRTAAISIIIMLLIIVIIVSDRGLKDHKSAHTMESVHVKMS